MAAGLTQYRERMKSLHRRNRASTEEAERKIVLGVAAALVGWGEKSKVLPVQWFGVPSKVILAVGGYLIAYNSSGATRRLANAASDAAVATYAYNAAKQGAVIAGEEYVGDEQNVINVQGDEI